MYTGILHATDLSENHYGMCKKAVQIAKALGVKLYLLHVIEPPPTFQLAQGLGFAELFKPVKEDAQTVMKLLGEALDIPTAQQFVEIGSIKMNILEKVAELGCNLIIIGSHTPSPLPIFLGSTAHTVLHKAPCDILTIRTKA